MAAPVDVDDVGKHTTARASVRQGRHAKRRGCAGIAEASTWARDGVKTDTAAVDAEHAGAAGEIITARGDAATAEVHKHVRRGNRRGTGRKAR